MLITMTEELYEQMYEGLESSMAYHERNKAETWAKVFTIFGKYDRDNRINVAGYHDEIYAGPSDPIIPMGSDSNDWEIEKEDAEYLIAAGWLFGEYGWKKFT